MILNFESLEKFGIVNEEELEQNAHDLYGYLNLKRAAFFKQQYDNNQNSIQFVKRKHEETEAFLENLKKNNFQEVQNYLKSINLGTSGSSTIRTMICLDGTLSMKNLIAKAKNTIARTFEKSAKVLQINDIQEDCIQIMLVVYRNYNSCFNELVQFSPWETKAYNLINFLEKIEAKGGW